MTSAEIRRKFLEFFKARGHQEVPSSPLVPTDDPTLLFTNAGMVQFKRVFQGLERRPYTRAVTCQKCVRAGGKHNDLEQVGHTARHHTFFEMLGNFSFGDYFKQEAIAYAWEWVTGNDWLGIDPDRLYVTVHHTDDDARQLWRKVAGVSEKRIYGLGDEDNFWQMADTGPAGPNTEIYVDLRGIGDWKKGKTDLTQDEFMKLQASGALLEIWNLVFMQYDLQKDGSRSPLPAPSVDTGAGLERVAAVMQDVPSNYDTDLFAPIIERAVEVVGKKYDRGPGGASYRVLADHARAVAFLLADGVYPSNEGRGYVLRRILRRAVRHAWLLGRREPTLVQLVHTVSGLMGHVYPELVQKRSHLESVTRAEEERFFDTIEGGLERLEQLRGAKAISGAEAFKLYDTFGFPIDLTQLIAGERGQTVDVAGFERELGKQRTRSLEALERSKVTDAGKVAVHVKRGGEWRTVKPRAKQKWVGYDTTQAETDVLRFRQASDVVEVVLQENPFYAESGGQVSDTGRVKGEGWTLDVEGVEKVDGVSAVVGHFADEFEPTSVLAQVEHRRRLELVREVAHDGAHSVYFLHALHVERPPFSLHPSRVADLPARLGVERILLQHHLHHVARLPEAEHIGLGLRGIVADPLLLGPGLHGAPLAAALHVDRNLPRVPSPAPLQRLERAGALLAQLPLEPGDVHRLTALAGDQLRQIDGKAERVVQLERLRAGDGFRTPQLLEPLEPALDRVEETLFFGARDAFQVTALLDQLRVHVSHQPAHRVHQLHQRRLAPAQQPGMAHRASQDAAQYVAAPLVRWVHAVRQQERHGTGVVREHPVGRASRSPIVLLPHHLHGTLDDRGEEIGVVVRRDMLHHRRQALEARAGVDGRRGKRDAGCVRLLIVLHENQVPDLEKLASLTQADEFVEAQVTLPASRIPHPADIDQDLRAGAARPGLPHLPEVVLVPEAVDAGVRDAGKAGPEAARLVVHLMHGDVQPLGRDAEPVLPGHQLPGVLDSLFLEVVSERKVAEHLEEGVVSRGMAHLLEVVVFAARPHAFLARHGPGVRPPLEPLKHALELHHPGVGEQERGIVRRDQGGAGHFLVPPGLEELQKLAADFSGGHGGNILSPDEQLKG